MYFTPAQRQFAIIPIEIVIIAIRTAPIIATT